MSDMHTFTNETPPLDPRITSILRYWDELRGKRTAPGRVEIRPSAITRHLSRICILERPRAGTVRMRLAGATMSSRMGMELRGMPFRALFDIDHREQAMDAAETAMTTPAVSILSLGRAERTGIVAEATLAILPLTDTRGALTRAMAIYSERPSVTPFVGDIRGRFTVQEAWTLDIPEQGPIIGSMGEGAVSRPVGRPTTTRVFRPHLAAQTAAPMVQMFEDAPETVLAEVHRPAFQVIDGGLS